jgi:hypothetical protein
MSTERIRELAKQAGLEFDGEMVLEPEPIYYTSQKDLEKFAALVAAEEREACALAVEQAGIEGFGTLAAAAVIRKRGNP